MEQDFDSQPGLDTGSTIVISIFVQFMVDKAPRLTIRRVIWILASDTDTVFVNSTNISTNIGTAMLSNSWSVELTNTAVSETKIQITLMILTRGAMSGTEMVRSLRSS